MQTHRLPSRQGIFQDEHAGGKRQFGNGIEKYFIPHYNEKTGQFLFCEEKIGVIEEELSYCGYFSIGVSEQMKASEAMNLYEGRDASHRRRRKP